MSQPQQNTQQTPPPSKIQVIDEAVRGAVNKVILALGGDTKNDADKSEAYQYVMTVLDEVKRSMGDSKKDLSVCTPESIVQAMIDAARMKLPIDGRGLAHLVKFGAAATLQVGYRGYIYKISQHYRGVDFAAEPVFDGDDLHITDESGVMAYTRTVADPFCDDVAKLRGVVCALSWFDETGVAHRKVATLSKEMIIKIKGTAKQTFIWDAWFLEKAKVAGIKRLCKLHFTNVLALQDVINYDNETNHEPAAAPAPKLVSPAQADLLKISLMNASEEGRANFMQNYGSYASVPREDFDNVLALLKHHKAEPVTITNQPEEKKDAATNN